MIKAIVFDLDNTITDFMKMKEDAVKAAVDAMLDAGLDLPREIAEQKLYDIYELEGIEYQRVFDRFLHEELGRVDQCILAAGIVGYRRAREAALVPYPHVNATLIELAKRGIKLAVVSDAPAFQAWLRLCYLRLHQIFDFVITIDDTGKQKPDPAPFRRALELLQVEPHEVLMVGDWPERDMVGAAKVGMKTIFARYGDTFGTISSGADYEIDDVAEIIGILEKESKVEKSGTATGRRGDGETGRQSP